MARLRDVARNPTVRSEAALLPYLALEHIEAGAGRLAEGVELETLRRDDAVAVAEGDVLFGKLRPYLCKVVLADEPLHCSSELLVVRPDESLLASRYLYYLLMSKPLIGWAIATSVGVKMPRTDWPALSQIELGSLPTLEEQHRVCRRLDTELVSLDDLAKELTIQKSLLEEHRSALITLALSGCLTSRCQPEDSGIPWIGRIPSDWKVMRLKNVGRATIGLTYDPEDVVDDPDAGTLVLRAGNIQQGRISLDDNVYVRTLVPEHLRTQEGDLLICVRNGSVRLIGKSAQIDTDMVGVTWGAFMSVFRSPMNSYLRWVLRSSLFGHQLGLFSTSTINQLTNATLHNFHVPVPPASERDEIVRHLERENERIDTLVAELEHSAALLKERKTAIITAAVTGQMEVD